MRCHAFRTEEVDRPREVLQMGGVELIDLVEFESTLNLIDMNACVLMVRGATPAGSRCQKYTFNVQQWLVVAIGIFVSVFVLL